MSEKRTFHIKRNGEWVDIFPETTMDQIIVDDEGTTLEEYINSKTCKYASKRVTAGTVSGMSIGTNWLSLKRYGRVVTAQIILIASTAKTGTIYKVFNIPDGYKPSEGVYQYACNVVNNVISGSTRFGANADGVVSLTTTKTEWAERYVNMTWITDDDFPS